MPILSIKRDFVGDPHIVRIISDDLLSVVNSGTYLRDEAVNIAFLNEGTFQFLNTDLVQVNCVEDVTLIRATAMFTIINADTVPELVLWFDGANNLPTFGQAAEKNVTDNADPLVVSFNPLISPTPVLGDIAVFADVNGSIQASGIPSANLLQSSLANPDPNANLFVFNVTATAAQLAGLGLVPLVVASGPAVQYRILELYLNDSATDFSGGGGDRDIIVSDGVTVYAVTPAASAQAQSNQRWGATDITFPSGATINQLTAAGANLRVQYFGGTTDYAAGEITLTGLVQRVV